MNIKQWEVRDGSFLYSSGEYAGDTGPVVGLPSVKSRANAQFIVKACNAHDDLIAACRYALDQIRTYNLPDTSQTEVLIETLECAIKKAE